LYFDGSDVGLGSATGSGLVGENVDAFTILPDGSVVVSTSGSATATGLAGTFTGQDLLRCIGSFGPTTTCSWSLYFKGSNVGLTTATENIDGVTVFGNNVVLSTASTFSVTGLSGSGSDVFACKAVTTGPATACGSFGMYFNGSAHGVTNNIDAFYSTRDPATLPAAGVLKAAAASPASASSPQPQVVK
jgi:hypothetical protein